MSVAGRAIQPASVPGAVAHEVVPGKNGQINSHAGWVGHIRSKNFRAELSSLIGLLEIRPFYAQLSSSLFFELDRLV